MVAVAEVKIFCVILQDLMIKGSGDFIEGNSSFYIPRVPKLILIDFVLIDIYFILSRDLTRSRDYTVM